MTLGRRQLLRASATLGLASAMPGTLGAWLTGCASSTLASGALGTLVEGGPHPRAFDARGLAWSLDAAAGRVEIRDLDGEVVRLVDGLAHPTSIALDAAGRAWIVEIERASVARVELDRGLVARLGEGVLRGPRDVAIDLDGQVLVADALAHQVIRLDAEGRALGALGRPVTREGEEGVLNGPRAVGVADDGTVLVAEIGGGRVTRLAPDGAWLGPLADGLTAPRALRVGPDGRVAIADVVRGTVTVLDADGLARSMHTPECRPEALAFGPDGALWVSGRPRA